MFNEDNTPREYLESGDGACIMYHAVAKRDDLNIYDDETHDGIRTAIEGLAGAGLIKVKHFGLAGQGLVTVKPTQKGIDRFTASLRGAAS